MCGQSTSVFTQVIPEPFVFKSEICSLPFLKHVKPDSTFYDECTKTRDPKYAREANIGHSLTFVNSNNHFTSFLKVLFLSKTQYYFLILNSHRCLQMVGSFEIPLSPTPYTHTQPLHSPSLPLRKKFEILLPLNFNHVQVGGKTLMNFKHTIQTSQCWISVIFNYQSLYNGGNMKLSLYHIWCNCTTV